MVHRPLRRQHDRRLSFRALLLAVVAVCFTPPAPAEGGIPDTIERVKPSIVAVGTFDRLASPQFNFAGTGFAVGDGTLIATNEHVVSKLPFKDGAQAIHIAIRTPKGVQVRPARRLAGDATADLAVLKIEGPALPALSLGNSEAVREGESYLLTGFPIGSVLGLYPVTHRAMIASITPIAIPAPRADKLDARTVRRIASGAYKVFQLDGTAYPGNSGSPVYHPGTGEVIAVVNSVFVKGTKEAALSAPSGITYAIPAQKLQELVSAAR